MVMSASVSFCEERSMLVPLLAFASSVCEVVLVSLWLSLDAPFAQPKSENASASESPAAPIAPVALDAKFVLLAFAIWDALAAFASCLLMV